MKKQGLAIILSALTFATATLVPAFAEAQQADPLVRALEETLTATIAEAEPSVVAIAMVEKDEPGSIANLELRPSPFGFPSLTGRAPRPTDADFQPTHYATGVLLDRSGRILTAYHALKDNVDYYVTTHDRKVRRANVKAADPRSDLAVLELQLSTEDIQRQPFKPITLGDASAIRKGQIVIALGNPHAVAKDGQPSAAWGIVSNLQRKLPPMPEAPSASGKDTLHHFGTLIQTDAKLNLGTSGGPLLDLDGQMIGLTTSLAAVAGYETAAGYAFPVDEAFREAVEILREGREVEYGFLGVQLGTLSLAEQANGLEGVRVERVVHGLPGSRYGLLLDDIITSINDQPVRSSDGLVLAISRLPLDEPARLNILRGDERRTIDVQLAKYPLRKPPIVTTPSPEWRGLRIDYPSILPDLGEWSKLGVRSFDDGVLITAVAESSPAWQAGLRPNSVISHVNSRPTPTPAAFRDMAANITGRASLRLLDPESSSGYRDIILQP